MRGIVGGNERTVWAQEGSGFYCKSIGAAPWKASNTAESRFPSLSSIALSAFSALSRGIRTLARPVDLAGSGPL